MTIWNYEHTQFFSFLQEQNCITIQGEDGWKYRNNLLKLKEIEEYPNRPIIYQENLFIFDYEKGFEIHNLKNQNKSFFGVRAVTAVFFAENILFLQQRIKLTIFNISTLEIEKVVPISESSIIYRIEDFIVFYGIKYGKTFLYRIQNKSVKELPNFCKNFGIITQVKKQEDSLIIFYSALNNLQSKTGVYVYNLNTLVGKKYCDLLPFSANCHKYLDFLPFSFNCNIEDDYLTISAMKYVDYLKFLLKNFGIYAMLYYLDDEKFNELEVGKNYLLLKSIIESLKGMMNLYPRSKEEYDNILVALSEGERDIKKCFDL